MPLVAELLQKDREMKPIIRLVALVLILALMPLVNVRADANCLPKIKAADCQLMDDASQNMSKMISFDLGYDISYKLTGGPARNLSVAIKGDGPIDFNDIADSDYQSVLKHLALTSNMTIDSVQGTTKQTATVEVRLVGGELYVSQEETGGDWIQLSLNRLLEKSAGGTPISLGAIVDILRPGSLLLFPAGSNTVNIIRATRQNGPKIENKATTQIVANFDYATYYRSFKTDAERKAFLSSFLVSLTAASGQRPSIARLQDPKLLAATERTVKTVKTSLSWIMGPDDKMLHGIGLNFSATVDPAVAALISSAFGKTSLVLNIKMLFTFTKIGDPVQIDPVTEPTTDITDTISTLLGIR
jgi:hypothetical protein